MYKKLFILFLVFFSKLESLPYKYQRLYRPEDGRCVDLISDIHLPQNPSESESKLTSIIEELSKTSKNVVDLFVEGTLDGLEDFRSLDGNFSGFFMKKLPANFIDKKLNQIDVKLIEPRTDEELILLWGLYKIGFNLGQTTAHIKSIIDNNNGNNNKLQSYDLTPNDKQFLLNKWNLFINDLKKFYDKYILGKEDLDMDTFFKSLNFVKRTRFFGELMSIYAFTSLDIEMLLNVLSSSKKHTILYSGGLHCKNISKDLEKIGFKKIFEKNSNVIGKLKTANTLRKYVVDKLAFVYDNIGKKAYYTNLCKTVLTQTSLLLLHGGELSKDTWDSLLKDPKEQYDNLPNPVVRFIKNHPVICTGTASLGLYSLSKCL